jgi:tetratricopeptide (TPR) repeat protein
MTVEGDALGVGLDEAPGSLARRAKAGLQRRAQLHRQPSKPRLTAHRYEHLEDSGERQFGDFGQLLERASARFEKRQYASAVSLLIRVLNRDETHAGAWHMLGIAFGELKRYQRAIESFDHVVELRPDWSTGWANRGWNRLRLKDYQGAVQDLLRATEIEPESAIASFNLAQAYGKLNQADKAVDAQRRATELDPWLALSRQGWTMGIRHIGDWPGLRSESSAGAEMPVNTGRIIRRENPLADQRDAQRREGLVKLWATVQNPVAWIVIFVIAALLYILLGN